MDLKHAPRTCQKWKTPARTIFDGRRKMPSDVLVRERYCLYASNAKIMNVRAGVEKACANFKRTGFALNAIPFFERACI